MNKKANMEWVVKLLIVLSVILIVVFFMRDSIPKQFNFFDDNKDPPQKDYDSNKLNVVSVTLEYAYGTSYKAFIGSANAKDKWVYHGDTSRWTNPLEYNTIPIILDGKLEEDIKENIENYVDIYKDVKVGMGVHWKLYPAWVKEHNLKFPSDIINDLTIIVYRNPNTNLDEIWVGNLHNDFHIMIELKEGIKATDGRELNRNRAVIQFET